MEPLNIGSNGWFSNPRYQPTDRIQQVLQRHIKEFRIRSFQNFSIDIYTFPTADAAEVYDHDNRWAGFNKCMFEVYGGTDSKPMLVRLCGNDQVQVRYMMRWASVSFYLEHLRPTVKKACPEPDVESSARILRWRQQKEWWMANNKHFRLMDLPPEIRERVYRYALGDQVEPYPTCRTRRLGHNTAAIVGRMPNVNLLYTSKRVYEEASHMLFKFTPFFVEHKGVLNRILRNHEQFSRIRRLQFALSHLEYLKLFGFQSGEINFLPGSAVHALKSMALDHLELYFAAPSPATPVDWLDNACQKIVVDWILDAAWPFIRNQPVKLAGYVKDSSRDRMSVRKAEEKEAIAVWQSQKQAAGQEIGRESEYYDGLDEDEGGVTLDETKENAGLQATETTLPPRCSCKRRCQLKRWTAKG